MSSGSSSIYQPPASNVDRPLDVGAGNFGSIAKGVAGEVSFDIFEIMSEAWQLTKGSKGVIVGAVAISYALSIAGSVLAGLMMMGDTDPSTLGPIVLQMAIAALTYPIFAGMFYYAIKRAAGDASAAFADVFSCFSLLLPLIGLYFLQGLFLMIGFVLLILPFIYLVVAYMLALPLLVDKRLGAFACLETSRKAVTHVWFRMFGLMILAGLAVAIGAVITLGIGLIWLGPWWVLCLGVAYRQIFGYGPEPAGAS